MMPMYLPGTDKSPFLGRMTSHPYLNSSGCFSSVQKSWVIFQMVEKVSGLVARALYISALITDTPAAELFNCRIARLISLSVGRLSISGQIGS